MINFRNPYIWDDLNDSVKEALASPVPVRVFQSVSHALIEIGQAFQSLYSHKRQYINGLQSLGNHADEMMVHLSRSGVKAIPGSGLVEDTDDKKTLFSVYDTDDAITGQKYLESGFIEQDSKIFRVFVFHVHHLIQWPSLNIGESDIYVLYHPQTQGAVALFGRRAQNINSLFCSTLNWSHFSHIGSFSPVQENKNWVQTLEEKTICGGNRLFQVSVNRWYDRALISWTSFDASALRDLLIQEHQVSQDDVECLSLSRWLDTKIMAQFAQRGWSSSTFRGTLILSARLSSRANFENDLTNAANRLISLSTF